jgi:hypothetical protein
LIDELSKPPVPERLLEYVDEGGLSAEEFHARFTTKSVPSGSISLRLILHEKIIKFKPLWR